MNAQPLPGENVIKALSNTTRREIMKQIVAKGGASYTEMMQILGLDPSLESGGFNYHLKELTQAGLIHTANGVYRITDLGEKALILLDQVSHDAKVDRFGVLHAALSMNPREELRLFRGQLGIGVGLTFLVFSLVSIVFAPRFNQMVIISAPFTFVISLTVLGWSFWRIGNFLGQYNLGLSSLLLINDSWFLIRSPNRGHFLAMEFTGISCLLCSMATYAILLVGDLPLIYGWGFILGSITIFLAAFFFMMMFNATRKVDQLEGSPRDA